MRKLLLIIVLNVCGVDLLRASTADDVCSFGWGSALKMLGIGYGVYAGGVMAHHIGSALTTRILTGRSVKIYLGASSYNDEQKEPLVSIMGLKIFSPFIIGKKNYTVYQQDDTISSLKTIIMNASGPLTTIACSAIALKYLSSLPGKHVSGGVQFLCAALLYCNILSETAGNILPIKASNNEDKDNEGYNIAQELNIHNHPIIKKLSNTSLVSRMARSLLGVGLASLVMHYLYIDPTFNPKGLYYVRQNPVDPSNFIVQDSEPWLGRIVSSVWAGLVAVSCLSINTAQHLLCK